MKSTISGFLAATITSAAALMASGTANAADIYQGGGSLKDAPIAAPAPISNWSGFYIGGHLGVARNDDDNDGDFEHSDDFFEGANGDGVYLNGDGEEFDLAEFVFGDDDDGEFTGGVHVGYNFQRYGSPLVLGVEGDLDFSENISYLASIRARAGIGTESALFYVTGGVAFIELDDDFEIDDDDFDDSFELFGGDDSDDSETGWVVGLGAEFKLSQSISLGLEGLYYSFDVEEKTFDVFDTFNGDDVFLGSFRSDDEFDFWQIRARLSFHTSGGRGPLEALR